MNAIAPPVSSGTVSARAPDRDDSPERLEALSGLAASLVERARRAGATQAEVACNEDAGLNVNVRMGAVESVESTRDRGISVTVYVGQRKGSASTADLRPESLEATVAQALAIARHTEDDEAAGLAEAELMATDLREFDAWHPWALEADEAVDIALACEAAGRDADARITNSEGASVSTARSLHVYANSHGFIGAERSTSHSIGCALIAGAGEAMQGGHWYTYGLAAGDLEDPRAIGRKAAERAVSRLDPREMATATMPVLFHAEVARSLLGHLIGAVSGGALYRRASFLLDSVGETLLPPWLSVLERPFLPRGLRSGAFDAEGVAAREQPLVVDGVLQRYLLSSYSARKLGLRTTGNAGGVFNMEVTANAAGLDDLLAEMGDGVLVTELMGQGVNATTGDYSRGAAGFRVEGGRITYPVDGITIAGNLKAMLRDIRGVGADIDPRSHLRMGSTLVGQMTVAGSL